MNRFTMEEHPICNFLAAYTAVNIYQTNMQSAYIFLAAYTAVNATLLVETTYRIFLAAYTAVNDMPGP
ncbi:TPA: hypothetical protein L4574_005625, partial [Pseudomonas aeruginosa]|nr:hypothetical protein [Pseudomonas aeruginosa]